MKKNTKGFTLAELLIVVAIIAVLVAISIPVFTSQLHKARVAADWAMYVLTMQNCNMSLWKQRKLTIPSFMIWDSPASHHSLYPVKQ